MAMEKTKKLAELTPLQEGEFWRIPHIAEKTAQKLHDAGIHTFTELARLSPDQIAAIVGGVGVKQKCLEFDWPGQALQFSNQLKQAKPAPIPAEEPDTVEQLLSPLLDEPSPSERRHLVSFVVELLLNNENQVQRTTVSLANRTAKAFWSGWDPERLSHWIAEQAHLRIKPPVLLTAVVEVQPTDEESAPLHTPSENGVHQKAKTIHIEASTIETSAELSSETSSSAAARMDVDLIDSASAQNQPAQNSVTPEPEIPAHGLSGELAVLAVDAYPRDTKWPSRYYQTAQPFDLRVSLDTSQMKAPAGESLRYRVDFYARRENSERSLRLAKAQGLLPTGSPVQINVPVAGLAEGVYRLETNVVVYLESAAHPDREGLHAFSEGGVLQAFPERVRE